MNVSMEMTVSSHGPEKKLQAFDRSISEHAKKTQANVATKAPTTKPVIHVR